VEAKLNLFGSMTKHVLKMTGYLFDQACTAILRLSLLFQNTNEGLVFVIRHYIYALTGMTLGSDKGKTSVHKARPYLTLYKPFSCLHSFCEA
jgi:hypothetical protein